MKHFIKNADTQLKTALLFAVVSFLLLCILAALLLHARSKLEADVAELSTQRALTENGVAFERTIANTEVERAALQNLVVVGQEDAVRFLSALDASAKAAGVALETTELSAQPPVKGGSFGYIVTTLHAEGEPQRVALFVQLVELLPFAKRINDLSLTETIDAESGKSVASATITLSVVLQP